MNKFYTLIILLVSFVGAVQAQSVPNLNISYVCNSGEFTGKLEFQGCLNDTTLSQQRCFYGSSFGNTKANFELGVNFLLPLSRKPISYEELCLRASGLTMSGASNSPIDFAVNSVTASRPNTSGIVPTLANCPIFVKVGRPFGVSINGYKYPDLSGTANGGADCQVIVRSTNVAMR
jgi:hypothetical protein